MTIYFYNQDKPYGEFSNFYPCEFQLCAREILTDASPSEMIDKTITVYNSEQAIMYMKAVLMNDAATALLIENASSPSECKVLGRMVSPYSDELWKAWREKVAVYILMQKFSSSDRLLQILLSTDTHDIAEASPGDSIWGIGISVKSAMKGANWRGGNILGRALMTVRENLATT